jgi:hypothetical protein
MTDLEASFTYAPAAADDAAWSALLVDGANDTGDTFLASGSEGGALLDQMSALCTTDNASQFEASRASLGWDVALSTWLSARPPSLRDRVRGWMKDAGPRARGDLTLHIGAGAQTGLASVTLETFAAFHASDIGLTAEGSFAWVADAGDNVTLNGAMMLPASMLIAHAADAIAAADVAGAADVPSALGLVVDCDDLAVSLVGNGTSYAGCDATCTANLCRTALATAWSTASAASSTLNKQTQVAFSASAAATVGDEAEPTDFSGGWIGLVVAPTGQSELEGDATATLPN